MKTTIFSNKHFLKAVSLFAALLILALVGCSTGSGGGDEATITLTIGKSSFPDKATVSIDQLTHVIDFSGPTGKQTHRIAGAGTIRAVVAPGFWRIDVNAFLGNELYAKGAATADVKVGQNTNVIVYMNVIWGDVSGGGGGGTPAPISVTVTSPANDVLKGASMQFTAIVTGSTQGVSWTLAGGTLIGTYLDTIILGLLYVDPAETSTSLTVTATSVEDATKSGSKTITVLTNADPPSIGTQPAGTVTPVTVPVGAAGATYSLTVAATAPPGGTLSYQWYSNSSASNSGGTAIGGATSATYLAPINVPGTFYYYVVVRNTDTSVNGNTTADLASNPVTLIVLQTGTVTINVTIDPINDAASGALTSIATLSRNGSPTTATVNAAGTWTNIKWYIDGNDQSIPNATITLNTANNSYNGIGTHFLTFEGTSGGKPYSKTVTFQIVN